MMNHTVRFRFWGASADDHLLDALDAEHFYTGARQVLGLSAHFYVKGDVPRAALSKTSEFSVQARAMRAGSVEVDFVVQIAASAFYDVLKYTFSEFFGDSIRSVISGLETEDPYFARIEPVLPGGYGNHQVFDFRHGMRTKRQHYRHRLSRSLIQTSRPVGRSANNLAISVDGRQIGLIDYNKELAITRAVALLRKQHGFDDSEFAFTVPGLSA